MLISGFVAQRRSDFEGVLNRTSLRVQADLSRHLSGEDRVVDIRHEKLKIEEAYVKYEGAVALSYVPDRFFDQKRVRNEREHDKLVDRFHTLWQELDFFAVLFETDKRQDRREVKIKLIKRIAELGLD